MKNRLREIAQKKVELRSRIEAPDANFDDIKKELESLELEQRSLQDKLDFVNKFDSFTPVHKPGDKKEERQSQNIIETPEYRSAYLKNLQGVNLNEAEQRALSTANTLVIPTTTYNKVVDKLGQVGVLLPHVTVLNIPGFVSLPVAGTKNDASWVSETASSTDSNDTINSVNLTAKKLIKTIEITAQVQAMSIDSFESFIVQQLANKIAKAVDVAILSGDGATQAKGILTTIETPVESAEAGSIDYDDIMSLFAAIGSAYAQNAKLIMSRVTLYGTIMKIKTDTKEPIFKNEADMSSGFAGKLLGYPVIVYDAVPNDEIIFGDLSQYYFNFAQAVEVTSDKSAGFRAGSTVYRAMTLADGQLAISEAVAVLKKKVA